MLPDRKWCGHGAYPGLRPFLFGTVVARDRHDAKLALDKAWSEASPHEPPDFEPVRGEVVFFAKEAGDAT